MDRLTLMQSTDPRIGSDVHCESQPEPPFTVFIQNDVNTVPQQDCCVLHLADSRM